MTVDEDGRPYIPVRRKLGDKQEKEEQEWRPPQGVVEENEEEEEQYTTIDEDGRPYIAVQRRQGDNQGKEEQEWRTDIGREKAEHLIGEETEEEEQYMTIGEDGRPYITVRIKQRQ